MLELLATRSTLGGCGSERLLASTTAFSSSRPTSVQSCAVRAIMLRISAASAEPPLPSDLPPVASGPLRAMTATSSVRSNAGLQCTANTRTLLCRRPLCDLDCAPRPSLLAAQHPLAAVEASAAAQRHSTVAIGIASPPRPPALIRRVLLVAGACCSPLLPPAAVRSRQHGGTALTGGYRSPDVESWAVWTPQIPARRTAAVRPLPACCCSC
jgi:hypothetical protein